MKPITVKILTVNANQEQLHKLGVSYNPSECERVEWTFVNIDYIAPSLDGPEFSVIGVSGIDYSCDMPYEKLKKLILES